MSPQKIYGLSVLITTIIRVLQSLYIPITGDEAYYATWGLRNLDLGYFDHPPAVAFLFAGSFLFGVSQFTARLAGILLPFLVSVVSFYFLSKETNKNQAYLCSSLILWLPICIFGVVVSPDTLLTLTVLLTFVFYWFAIKEKSYIFAIISGVFLGLSFLSKLLILPYVFCLIFSVFFLNKSLRWTGVKLLVAKILSSLPFIGVWVYWNSYHCWSNFMLHGVNRHKGGEWSIEFLFQFLIFQVLIFTPFIFYFILREKKEFYEKLKSRQDIIWAIVLAFGPVLLFGLASFGSAPSLHWPMPYNILILILLGLFISFESLKKMLYWVSRFSIFMSILSLSILWSSSYWLPKHANGKTLEIFFNRDYFYSLVKPYFEKGMVLATDSYTLSSLLEFEFYSKNSPVLFSVIGSTSAFGRQDDLVTDYRSLNGRSFAIFSRGIIDEYRYGQWFNQINIHPFSYKGWDYYIVEGIGFKFDAYRETVLEEVIRKNYNFPRYLPVLGCPIIKRHF